MRKRILVTAGPIPAYIDPVKIVTNGFKGGLAKRCATDLRDTYGHHVDLMVWEMDAMRDEDWDGAVLRVHDVRDYVRAVAAAAKRYDAIVCAAAVANLMPSTTLRHKFASHELRPGDAVSIPFEIAPRAVDEVKRANPRCTLIAYKCLDADEKTLREAAATVLADAKADVVFANTPKDAKSKKLAMFKDGAVCECDFDEHTAIIDEVVRERHYRTKTIDLILDTTSDPRFAHAMQQVRLFESTMPTHGSVAIPVNIRNWPDAFVTTSRGHRDEPVIVLNVNDEKQVVYASGKATLNAPALMAAIRAHKGLYPEDEDFVVVHRHFSDPRYSSATRTPNGRVQHVAHVSPGTVEETELVRTAFGTPNVRRVEIQSHGAIYIRHMVPTDWTRYHTLYPSRYMSDSKEMDEAIESAKGLLGQDLKARSTLEVGAGGDTECAYALDTSVNAKNAENVTWDDIREMPDDAMELTIMRNCIAYLSRRQLVDIFRVSRRLVANTFDKAPQSILRNDECATCVEGRVTHSLLLPSDDVMTHGFYVRDRQLYDMLGARCLHYGKNSLLLTKGI